MNKSLFMLFLLILLNLFFEPFFVLGQRNFIQGTIKPERAFQMNDKTMFPEGIAYDSKTKKFFISSLSKSKVISIDKSGKQADFIQSGQDSLLRGVSLKIDEKRRRLWILSNSDWSESVISAIHIYNLDKKQLIYTHITDKGSDFVFNDIALSSDGDAFIGDIEKKSIFHVDPEKGKIELLVKSVLWLSGLNGICLSPDNTTLYVSTSDDGMVMIDVVTKKIKPIENPLAVDMNGIDGLILYNNSLIGIMSKDDPMTEPMIVRYQLNLTGETVISATIIDQKNPELIVPTNGVMVGDILYCLASTYLNLFSLDENKEDQKLGYPLVLKYKLGL